MYTAAIGAERRLLDSTDLRLMFSLRGSYNPSFRAALTLGLGWFF